MNNVLRHVSFICLGDANAKDSDNRRFWSLRPRTSNQHQEETVETPYGTVKVKIGEYNGEEIVFLARHGEDTAFHRTR